LPFHHRHHLGKIIKIVATRGHVLRLKCTKYYFGWGSAPDPLGEITVLAQNHWKGPAYINGEWEGGRQNEGRALRKGREGRGRNVAFHHLL